MKARSAVATVAIALFLGACGESNAKPVEEATTSSSLAKSDIVETAQQAGQFKTLLVALKAADLDTALKAPGPFTVFAPTDDAFAKLPAGTLDSLLKPENKAKLKAILTYHVVAGNVPASEAMKLKSTKTLNGKDLSLDASGGTLKVGSGTVVKSDIAASNGVIHVVDTVLLPSDS